MNEQTLNALKELAAKLGTTAEHLWSVLIRQAYISFATDLVLYFVLALAMWLSFKKLFPFLSNRIHEDPDGDFAYWIAAGMTATLLVLCILLAIFNITDTVTKIANPEYWALMRILDAIGGAK